MRKLYILGAAVFAVLAFGALSAASAFASNEWLVAGASISSNVLVDSEGTLTLEDLTNGVVVDCNGLNEGFVGASGKDEITKIVSLSGALPIPCELLKPGTVGCGEPTQAEPLGLPWVTQLTLNGAEQRDLIEKHTGGVNPGWKTECLVAGLFKVVQECSAPDATVKVTNEANGKVDAEFDNLTEEATCKNGDKANVLGLLIILTASGSTLAVS